MRALVALAAVVAAGGQAEVTPGQLKAQIASRGAAVILSEVYDHPNTWPVIFDGICRGDAAWLEVAVLLRPVSDAGASEDLDQAMAEALVHAPRSALGLMRSGAHYKTESVCGNFEVIHRRGKDTKRAAVLRWLQGQAAAVRSVKGVGLRETRARCLVGIHGARASVRDPCFGLNPAECGAR
jgi:hypothetical protein